MLLLLFFFLLLLREKKKKKREKNRLFFRFQALIGSDRGVVLVIDSESQRSFLPDGWICPRQWHSSSSNNNINESHRSPLPLQPDNTCLLHLAFFFILYLLITTCVVVLYTWLKVSNHQTCANTCGIISIPWKMCLYPPPLLLILRAQLKRFFRCIAHTLTTLKLIRHSPSLDSLTSLSSLSSS